MALGTDLRDFVNAFIAGSQLVPSQLDKQKEQAQIDASGAQTALAKAQAAAIPAQTAYQLAQAKRSEAMSDYYLKRGDWYDRGGSRSNANMNIGTPGDTSWIDGQGSSENESAPQSAIPASSYDPNDPTQNPYASAPDASVDVNTDSGSGTADDGSSPDQLNYAAPAIGGQPLTAIPATSTTPAGPVPPANIPNAGGWGPNVDVSQLPAGMRNNNPGNIKYSPNITWQGQVGPSQNTDQGDPQVVFSSQAAGMRALAKNVLFKYNNDGANTIAQLIAGPNGWTPGYAAGAMGVAKAAGIPPNQPINMSDPAVLTRVMRGIVSQEHGPASKLYSDQMLYQGAATALGDGTRNGGASDALAYVSPRAPASNSALGAIGAAAGPSNGPMDPVKGTLKAGMQVLSNRFAPQGNNAGVPAAGAGPNVRGYLMGDTAAPHSVVQKLRSVIDPDKKMTDSEFSVNAIKFITDNDAADPQQKAGAVADLLQYYRVGAMQYAAIAKAAVQSGNLDDATKAMVKAYNHIPDGQSVQALKQDNGDYKVVTKDDQTGAITQQTILSPAELGGQIMKIQPNDFDNMVMGYISKPDKSAISPAAQAAIKTIGDTNGFDPDAASTLTSATDLKAYNDAVKEYTSENKGVKGSGPLEQQSGDAANALMAQFQDGNVRKALGNVADIYTTKLTGMQTDIQTAFVTALRRQDLTTPELVSAAGDIMAVDPTNPDAKRYTAKKTGNTYQVAFKNGGQITLPASTFNTFNTVRDQVVDQLQKQADDEAKALKSGQQQTPASGIPTGITPIPGVM